MLIANVVFLCQDLKIVRIVDNQISGGNLQ